MKGRKEAERWAQLADRVLIIAREIQFRGYSDPRAFSLTASEGMVMRYLLAHNLRLMFGGFGLSVDDGGKGAIVLTHTILGDGMDRVELYASVSAIARVADDLDDQIVATYGGKTALDKLTAIKHEPVEYWE